METTTKDFIVVFALIGHRTMKVPTVLVVKSVTALRVYKQNAQDVKRMINLSMVIIFAIHAHSIHQVVRHVTMKALYFALYA